MRKLWMTVLLLSISLISIVGPVYVESYENVAAKKTTTTTTDLESSSTSATVGAEATYGFILKVDPPSHKIQHLKNGKTRTATYSVKVQALAGFRGEVELSVKGLPKGPQAWFNPEEGVPKPVFVSVLKIVVPPSTAAGVYPLRIIGSSSDMKRDATTTLIVEGEATPPTSPQEQKGLVVTVSTDKENYERGDNVSISGYVKLSSGVSLENATVSLNVLDQDGKPVHAAATETDQTGRYSEEFSLPASAAEGTYTVYATASMTGYKDSYATVTFTVGVSLVPSVHIVNATVTMLNGTAASEFHPGETVVVWAVVNNTGADLVDGNMWVEALDPDKSPIALVVVVVTVHTGEQAKIGIHVILGLSAKLGTYTARILVSDGPIMAGGKFLDSKEMAFIVSSESNNTTTTTTTLTTSTTTTGSSETTWTTSTSTSTGETTSTTSTGSSETTSSTTTSPTETTSTSTTQTTSSTSTSESETSSTTSTSTTETTSTSTTGTTSTSATETTSTGTTETTSTGTTETT